MNECIRQLSVTARVPVRGGYLPYLPKGYRAGDGMRWPVLFFLHGMGERGSDLSLVKRHGPPREIGEGRELPFIVVAPPCPADRWWETVALNAIYDRVMCSLRADASRVYLTGLSMDGFGTWAWANESPRKFAAIAPICGPSPWIDASRFKTIPVWCFHGALDAVVPIEHSIRKVREIRATGGRIRFTVYPDAEHDSWSATYRNAAFYRWLLKHRRPRG